MIGLREGWSHGGKLLCAVGLISIQTENCENMSMYTYRYVHKDPQFDTKLPIHIYYIFNTYYALYQIYI